MGIGVDRVRIKVNMLKTNQVANIVGIFAGGIGVAVGSLTHWASWTWLSVVGLALCLIAAPSIWRHPS